MTAAAAKTSETSDSIGKAALATALGWSRPKLDRRLLEDASFPVLTRGDRSGGWAFDLVAVSAYLNGSPAPALAAAPPAAEDAPEPEAAAAPVQLSAVRAQHSGEATARQMRDSADAELKMDRLRRARGELVEAAVVKEVMATVMVELRTSLLGMPEAIGKEFDLPERVALAMRARVETMMRALAERLRQQLAIEPPAADQA